LQKERLIDVWYDRDIHAGREWDSEIDKHRIIEERKMMNIPNPIGKDEVV
jgi:hypothetical protein